MSEKDNIFDFEGDPEPEEATVERKPFSVSDELQKEDKELSVFDDAPATGTQSESEQKRPDAPITADKKVVDEDQGDGTAKKKIEVSKFANLAIVAVGVIAVVTIGYFKFFNKPRSNTDVVNGPVQIAPSSNVDFNTGEPLQQQPSFGQAGQPTQPPAASASAPAITPEAIKSPIPGMPMANEAQGFAGEQSTPQNAAQATSQSPNSENGVGAPLNSANIPVGNATQTKQVQPLAMGASSQSGSAPSQVDQSTLDDLRKENAELQGQIEKLRAEVVAAEQATAVAKRDASTAKRKHSSHSASSKSRKVASTSSHSEKPQSLSVADREKIRKALDSFKIKAIVEGLAWIQSPLGQTLAVKAGDKLSSNLEIVFIDPVKMVVKTNLGDIH